MAEELFITESESKLDKYSSLYPQLEALFTGEEDLIANMANLCAALKETFGWLWVGFYLVKEDELVLGPFQGPIACTRIQLGKGVCGSSWETSKAIIVPDVNEFPGHIACSSDSQSEIVLPIIKDSEVIAVLDVDSSQLNEFDGIDAEWLQKIGRLL